MTPKEDGCAKGGWRGVELSFWEGGRAKQTPAALKWQDRWHDLELVSESLEAPPEAGGAYGRRYLARAASLGLVEILCRGERHRARLAGEPAPPM